MPQQGRGGQRSRKPRGRQELKEKLFLKFDEDGDGYLSKAEMHQLATHVGFDGSEEDWEEEYQKLCDEHGVDAHRGVPEAVVFEMLDDETEKGCWCTDQELKQLLGLDGKSKRQQGGGGSGGEEGLHRVFFAQASFSTEEDVLRRRFEQAGTVKDFTLFRLPDGRSRGMGRVAYGSAEEARHAVATLHRVEVDGRALFVKTDVRDGAEGEGGRGASEKGGGGGSKKDWSNAGGYNGRGQLAGRASDAGAGGGRGEWQRAGGGGGGKKSEWSAADGGYSGGSVSSRPDRHAGGDPRGGKGGGNRLVFFAGAAFETSQSYLEKKFAECGRISQFWLFKLPDGRSRGMGVVEYKTAAEAQYAIENMHRATIDGRGLLVKEDDVGALEQYQLGKAGGGGRQRQGGAAGRWERGGSKASKAGGYDQSWEQHSNRVFFAGAPFTTPAASIREYFEEYGAVQKLAVFRLPDGRSRGMGVCTYASSHDAQQAIWGGIEVEGWALHLQEDTNAGQYAAEEAYAAPPKSKGYSRSAKYLEDAGGYGKNAPNVDPSKACFFANVPYETTETFLWKRFESVGPVRSLHLFMTQDGRSRGMGVVEYASQAAAFRAYQNLHETPVGSRSMIVDEYRPP